MIKKGGYVNPRDRAERQKKIKCYLSGSGIAAGMR